MLSQSGLMDFIRALVQWLAVQKALMRPASSNFQWLFESVDVPSGVHKICPMFEPFTVMVLGSRSP